MTRVKRALRDLVAPIVLESSLLGSLVVTCVYSLATSGVASETLPGIRLPLVGLRGGWRREGVNVTTKQIMTMNKKLTLTFATWNVRTLLDTEQNLRPRRRTALVAHELRRYDIDIAALSETRLSGEGNLIEAGEGYTFFWKGYPENVRRNHGVGFAVRNKLLQKIETTPVGISERLMSWRLPLAKGRYVTLISAYAPTLNSEDDIKDTFYRSLDATIRSVPRNDKLILLGDFNARVGEQNLLWPGVLGNHGIGNMNNNGERLLSLCSEHSLVITNTIFQLKNKHKTTWMHPRSKHWHLIDYVIVRQRDRGEVLVTRAMRGAECSTDHNLIRSKMKISIRPQMRRQPPSKKLNCSMLKDAAASGIFRRTLEEKLSQHPPIDPTNNATNLDAEWLTIKTLLQSTAEETLGFSTRSHQDWFDANNETIHDLLAMKNRAHNNLLAHPASITLKNEFRSLRREIQQILRDMENMWWTNLAKELQRLADSNDQHGFYKLVSTIYGPTKRNIAPVRSAEGELLKDNNAIRERWRQHFNTLLNQRNPVEPTILDTIPNAPQAIDLDEPPSFDETVQAIRSLKNNKSPGPDGIPSELIKEGGQPLHQHLHNLIKTVWHQEQIPAEWRTSDIVTIYKKKGDRSDCNNSRGISLLPTASKVLAKIMLMRLTKHLTETTLPETQCGFRKERSTCDMIFVARQIQEKCHEQNRELYIAFIDLAKAFDTVNRELLWNVLSKFGVPYKFLTILKSLHDNMTACVSVGGSKSEPFNVEVGVKQGCVLAPVIFNIYLTAVTLLSHQQMNPDDGVKIQFRLDGNLFNLRRLQAQTKTEIAHFLELQYADDCAVLAHTPEALQRSLTIISNIYQAMGLRINVNKTEIISQRNNPAGPLAFQINGEEVKQVENFKYLGSVLTHKHNIDAEVLARINQASTSFGRLRSRVFENTNLRIKTKVSVYTAVCLSTLLYGAESWTTYRRHIKQLESFHIRCLQRILGLRWQDKVPHSEILQRAGTTSIETMLARKQLRWVGHVFRMPEHRLPRQMLYGQLSEARRNPGGQKKRYKDQIKITMKKCNIMPRELEANASDRKQWRALCREGSNHLEEARNMAREERRQRRHNQNGAFPANPDLTCQLCGKVCGSRIGLFSHARWHGRQ